MKLASTIFAITTASLIAGCGSITRGTTEKVAIDTEPTGAAITTSIGKSCFSTPCGVEVPRKTEFTVYANRPGYHTGEAFVGTKVSGGGAATMAGNLVFGGIIGVGIDAATGASLSRYPNPVHIKLVPSNQSAPKKTTKTRKHTKGVPAV